GRFENPDESDGRTSGGVRPVAPGENALRAGEDVARGDLLVPGGHLLRPQDLGGLLGVGITEITAARRPVVGLLATGDEIVPPEAEPVIGQIRDINTYTVAA